MSEKIKRFNPMALREKYSVGSLLNKKNNFSSFWLNEGWDNTGSIFDEEDEKPKTDLIALSSYRRAIANFVNILTKKDIPVTFTTAGDSYTDGKKVTISAKLDDKLFDSSVGLALHEGSHILLSDFEVIRNLEISIPKEYFNRAEVKGFSKNEILSHIKNLLNYVEDRRIDNYVFTSSPGYKGYYHSMYNKYFHAKVIDKALGTDEYTSLDWDSYIFRILNMTNKNSKLNALTDLNKIYHIIFKNDGGVKNLKSTEDSLSVALNVYDIILNNIPDGMEKVDEETGEVTYEKADGKESSEKGEGEGSGGSDDSETLSDEEFNDLLDSVENDKMSSGGNSGGGKSVELPMDDESSNSSGGVDVGKETKKVELTDNQKRQLAKAIEKQKKFMDGDITKKKVSKKDKAAMDAIDASGMSYKEVGKDLKDRYTGEKTKGTKCIVVKNLNKTLIESGTIDILRERYYTDEAQSIIDSGLRLGTILGKKLSIRTESRDTKYTRKDSGRIDKRLIAELGFDNNNVFSQTFVETYPDAHLHISVDASGSMSGDKMNKTMKSVTAMVKAIDMIEGVEVVVSFRSTQNSGTNYRSNEQYPIILIAYDSTKDNIVKVKTLWKHIRAGGTTPEGLCFEAIEKDFIPGNSNQDSYFINYSDGQPIYSNNEIYCSGETAIKHTAKMVSNMKAKGMNVLSYFIGSRSYDDDMGSFKKMYGTDASFINATNMMEVAKTMNRKFLSKENK